MWSYYNVTVGPKPTQLLGYISRTHSACIQCHVVSSCSIMLCLSIR